MARSWHVWQNRVRVGETRVGRAVFALKAFKPTQIIGVVQGIVSSDPLYGSEYCMDLGQNHSLEPIPPFRYVNHSCEPNAEIQTIEYTESEQAHQLFLTAIRPIQPGDELTIDYAWTADAAIPCLCGSAKCRGWIVDEAELGLVTVLKRSSEQSPTPGVTTAPQP